jgi:hypothetical protein
MKKSYIEDISIYHALRYFSKIKQDTGEENQTFQARHKG